MRLRQQDIFHAEPAATASFRNHLHYFNPDFETSLIQDLEKGRIPSVLELNNFALLMEADEIWSQNFNDSKANVFHLDIQLFDRRILNQLRSFVTKTGDINESGFSEMRELNEAISRIEHEARKAAQEIRRTDIRYSSEAGEFDIINERYVLPISSDRYSAACGPIIHRSRTGMTLYVEAPAMQSYSLKRSELLAERDWLIFKKCRELAELITPLSHKFSACSNFILEFDILYSLYGFAKNSNLTRPVLSDSMHLEFIDLFHPLVEGCVKNNVVLSQEKRGFILSGPNTGGKTVLLKSIAVATCLLRIGAWLPCAYGHVFPYRQLFFFSHDLQDLHAGLSSFSSEVKNYTGLIEDISNDSLVIIDEIFNSTSSEEASALAVALLEYLETSALPHICLSTHHHGIKTTASTMHSFISCHMAVSPGGLPLYKVIWGSPGSSRGIDTFDRLTHSYSWGDLIAKRARELLGNTLFDYEKALSDINEQKAIYMAKIQEANEQALRLKNEREAFKLQKESTLATQQGELLRKYNQFVDKAKSEIERFKNGDTSSRRALDHLADGRRELMPKKGEKPEPTNLRPLPKTIEVNTKVWSKSLRKTGTVMQVASNKLLVDFKGLRSWIKTDDLQLAFGEQEPARRISINVQRESSGTTTLDSRGVRLEKFQSDVNDSLQDLFSGDIPYLDIIHGHGDGILKKWLREYLKHERDLDWSPLDGNDGTTRVLLKK